MLNLLAEYSDRGMEVWLELGLQTAFDESVAKENRGHKLKEYFQRADDARRLGIPVCTHLIVGMPGEEEWHALQTLDNLLNIGTGRFKLHTLHVVKGTQLANQWRRGEYAL